MVFSLHFHSFWWYLHVYICMTYKNDKFIFLCSFYHASTLSLNWIKIHLIKIKFNWKEMKHNLVLKYLLKMCSSNFIICDNGVGKKTNLKKKKIWKHLPIPFEAFSTLKVILVEWNYRWTLTPSTLYKFQYYHWSSLVFSLLVHRMFLK
jgi:hypothetical protein